MRGKEEGKGRGGVWSAAIVYSSGCNELTLFCTL